MLGELPFYYKFFYWPMWAFITPVVLTFVTVYALINLSPPEYAYGYKDGNYEMEPLAFFIQYFIDFFPLVVFVAILVVTWWQYAKREGGIISGFKASIKPTEKWEKMEEKIRKKYVENGSDEINIVDIKEKVNQAFDL